MIHRFTRPLNALIHVWNKDPLLAWGLSSIWLLVICGLAFLWQLGGIGLIDETEPLFAEAARQMTVTGDWITPYFNGETRFDKPPLVYWLMAIAYQVIGVNEWAVRLPSALAAIALTVMGFVTLRYFGFPQPKIATDPSSTQSQTVRGLVAWIGAAAMALNLQTITWARTGVSDMLLSGCMGTALFAFFWGYAQPDRPKVQGRWYIAFYILSALAVLAKGPVGVVIPGLIIGVFLIVAGQFWTVVKEMRLLPGILIFLAIAVPWYVLVIQANGDDYIDSFFGYHNFERFTEVVNDHSAPWYFYFPTVLVGFFPWAVYLPVAIARLRVWRWKQWQKQPRSGQLGLFALTWFAVIFGFFTVAATKLPSYVLPLIPASAILVGLFWSDRVTRPIESPPPSANPNFLELGTTISHWAFALLSLVLAGVIFYSPNWMDTDSSMPNLPDIARESLALPIGIGIWVVAAIATVSFIFLQKQRWIWTIQLVSMVLFLSFTVMPFAIAVDAQRQLPLRQLSATALEVQQPGETIAMVGFMKPSIVFYTQQPITFWINHKKVIRNLHRTHRRTRPRPESMLLVGQSRKIEATKLPESEYDRLQESGAYELVRVHLPLPRDVQHPEYD